MEQRKEIVNRYVQLGLRVERAVGIAGISKSAFYYKSTGKTQGKIPSKFTRTPTGLVPNEAIVKLIEHIIGEEFIDYGYDRVTSVLRKSGFEINRKKTYRLMKENGLLQNHKQGIKRSPRKFVQYTSPDYSHPFATIELDIKYVYLREEKRNSYLLTAIDTFTRIALGWELSFRMTHEHVIDLVKKIKAHPLIKPYNKIKIRLRTDNGPQFIAINLAAELASLEVEHEFIRPGTPQQNGHIESFHSTLQKIVLDSYELGTLEEARTVLDHFYQVYNNKRIMKALTDCSPVEFLTAWESGAVKIITKNQKKIFFRERQPLSDTALSREDSFGCIKITQ